MTLVRKSIQEDLEQSDVSGLQAVSLSPTQRVLANVTTARARRQTINREIQAAVS